ncbi:hypothetical protein GCM10023321_72650 [Pseudonocardia eucalypti]|uniref:TrbL/VirB6 plasmid conjugal transfer protein n=1 Tax=Pseudonocardia eucalypti TaxID=648755 RepID=A0ABP9R779_9PSEU|nr:hypothetical protein [Pseudonocardia eucalypti]
MTDHVVLPGLDPLLRLLSGVLLNAPDPRCMPGMVELWGHTRTIAVALYGLLITAAALIVMGHQTVQTRYSLRDLAPRLVLGFAAANLSLWIIGLAVGFGNALTTSVLGTADTSAAQTALRELIGAGMRDQQAGAWMIFVTAAFVVVVVLVLIGYVQRLALLAILTVAAPLALACHALPGLDRLAAWWWRAFAALLGAQFAQALTLVVALKIFLAPGAVAGSGVLAEQDMRVFLALGVVVLMAIIPIRVMSAAKLSQGSSILSSVVRTVLMIKTLGAVKAGRAATGAGGRTAAGRTRPRVPRHPGIGPRHWPYAAATGPAGRGLAAARQAHRAQAPGQPRPAPGRLRPPGQPAAPPGMPHTLRLPRPGAQPPPPGVDTRAAGGRASNDARPNPRPLVTRAPGTSGPRPAPPPTVTPRPAVRRTDAPPRAGGRTTPPRARPAVSPRPPHPSGRRRPR